MNGLGIRAYDSAAPFTVEDFLDKLFPNFWSLLINLVALIVLFVFLYHIAYKPVKKYLDARKEYVEKNIRDSETSKAMYEKKVLESETMISNARKEAGEIISKAKGDAEVSAESIIKSANERAEARQKAADEAIAQTEEKSRRAIHEEIVNVALDASKAVLGREVNKEDNAKLVDEFVESVDE